MMDHLQNLRCLEDDAPLENETFAADQFFLDGPDDVVVCGSSGAPPSPAPLTSVRSTAAPRASPPSSLSPPPPKPPVGSSPSSTSSPCPGAICVPLRQFVRDESFALASHAADPDPRRRERCMLRRTTVAYAIAELLCHSIASKGGGSASSLCRLDNFVVRVSSENRGADCGVVVEGVDMISPPFSLRLVSPFFLSDEFWGGNDGDGGDGNANNISGRAHQEEELGRYVEVEIIDNSTSSGPTSHGESDPHEFDKAVGKSNTSPTRSPDSTSEENIMCYLLGTVLYELYSEKSLLSSGMKARSNSRGPAGDSEYMFSGMGLGDDSKHSLSEQGCLVDDSWHSLSEMQPPCKKVPSSSLTNGARDERTSLETGTTISRHSDHVPLKELGFPVSISLLVENLLDCGWDEFRPDDAVPSLAAARDDLHLLLLDPCRFLFDAQVAPRSPDIKFNVPYGRDAERSLLVDVFCRVSLTGDSEALLVGGHSGSGKSTLVGSVLEYVDVAGGYITREKFDPAAGGCSMSVVIAAFDGLCPVIKAKNSVQELEDIVAKLMAVFGTQLSTLARLLPRVELLIPGLVQVCPEHGKHQDISDINLGSVYFILQLFTRVVSSKSHPVMIFLDDLHWADNASLNVLQHIMADPYGCTYLVGSYRSNEVLKDHALFRLMKDLEVCNVQLTKLHLDGMEINDVNHMISDALGVFPRVCRPLSQVVVRKTKGNPLFVRECLRSLVDRKLLLYSVRERRWVWDTDAVGAEDIADNVSELLSIKMIGMPEVTQLALKIAACFGTTLDLMVITTLMSASPKFSSFRRELDNAVDEGFMDKDGSCSSYRFVHDKVREAAYGLIPEEEKNEFHNSIGRLLHHGTQANKIDDMIFFIVDQINHGTISDPQQRVSTAELNYKAASNAIGNSNIAEAYFYINAAINHLPPNHWESHYELSRSIFLVLGNTAYRDGHIKGGMRALDSILERGKSLKDKLDAYYLKIALLHSRQELKLAYDTCVGVLEQLGESIPASVEPKNVVGMVGNIQSKLDGMSESDFMNMKTIDSPFHYSLTQFYNQVCYLSYFIHNEMLSWYACRLVEISLEHGFCKYSALGIMRYSMVLGGKLIRNVQGSYKVGKMAMKLLDRFDATDLLPIIYLCYYGFIAVHIEPIQSCADMLKRGSEIALSLGDRMMAVINAIHYIQKSFFSGTNLSILKKECDYQMRLIEAQPQPFAEMYIAAFRESIEMLTAKENSSDPNRSNGDVPLSEDLSETLIFHGVLQNFWLGRFDRCLYYADRASAISDVAQLRHIMISFYGGIACFRSSRKGKKKSTKLAKQAIDVMKEDGRTGLWNYQCKIHLLEAEILTSKNKKDSAKASFNAAISAARSSKFIHEEGLACELAALYFLEHGDKGDAKDLFEHARECYAKWGSQVKVDFVTKELQKMSTLQTC